MKKNSVLTFTTVFLGMLAITFFCKAAVGNVDTDRSTVYLKDFTKVTPQDAISLTPVPGKWQLRPMGDGTVLYSDGSAEVPWVTYPLELKGWYDIYVGLVERPYTVDASEWQGIHVKLTGELAFTHIYGGRTGLGKEWETAQVDEFFWKRADLTGQGIMIYQPYGRFFRPAGGIKYIKLVPKTEKQVKADNLKKEQIILKAGKKDVCGMADFWSYVFMNQGIEPKNTEEVINHHKNAGFNTIFLQINADGTVHYPSKVAQEYYYIPEAKEEFRSEAAAYPALLKNHDPVKVACERAHELDIKFFPWFRMTNEHHPDSEYSEYSKKFRHLKIRGADGDEPRWMSLAYKEIRDYKLAILNELVTNYSVDGLFLDYLRTMPMIGYEPPVVEAYVKKYGVDPTKVIKERSNPRWKKYRAEYVTIFMRDLKKIVEAEEKKTGRKIEIAVRVNPRDNLWKGMDVKTWIKEGLVDIVVPCNYSMFDPPISIAEFKKMAKGTKCKIYGGINPFFAGGADDPAHEPTRHEKEVIEIIQKRMLEGPTNLEYSQRALDYYQQGADGVVIYESEALTKDPPMHPGRAGLLPMLRTLSNPIEVMEYVKSLKSGK